MTPHFTYCLRLEPADPACEETTRSSGPFPFITFWRHRKAFKAFVPWKLRGVTTAGFGEGGPDTVCPWSAWHVRRAGWLLICLEQF